MVGSLGGECCHLLDHLHVELLDADEGGLALLAMVSSFVLVVPQHHLHPLVLFPQYDVVAAGILLLPHLPLVPLSREPVFPALQDHPVHVFLEVFADAPQADICVFVALIQVCLYVVVAKLLVWGVLLKGGEAFHNSHFPEEAVAVLRGDS